jgi:hypothetical protein
MGAAAAAREAFLERSQAYQALIAAVGESPDDPADRHRVDALLGQTDVARQRWVNAKAAADAAGPATSAGVSPFLTMDGRPAAGGRFPFGGRPDGSGESWGATVAAAAFGPSGFRATGLVSAGSVPVTVPLAPGVITDPMRAHFLKEIIPQEDCPNGVYAFMVQTARVNRAAPVAPLGLKPESTYTMVRHDDRTRTIAHLSEPMPRQQLSDAPLLRQFLDSEMRYGLDLALDYQILNGNGIGENMTGILDPGTGIGLQTFDTDVLTTCRKAITVLQLLDRVPDWYVFNPVDWEEIEFEIRQLYLGSNVAALVALTRVLYGIPVLVTNAITAGTGLLGDFASSALLHVTQQATIDWSENVWNPDGISAGVGASDFQMNAIRFRAEVRENVSVGAPLGFVKVELAEGS